MAIQIPDRIMNEGLWMDLYSNPLEQYWTKLGIRRPKFSFLPNCKRGYVAQWELTNRQLFLCDIQGNYERRTLFHGTRIARCSLHGLFPKSPIIPIKAFWFSGKLRVPTGKMTLYGENGFDSRFESELIITVNAGDILKIVSMDFVGGVLTQEAQTFFSK